MPSDWHYMRDGSSFGPFSKETLAEMLREGSLTSADRVRQADDNHWVEMASIFPSLATKNETPPIVDVRHLSNAKATTNDLTALAAAARSRNSSVGASGLGTAKWSTVRLSPLFSALAIAFGTAALYLSWDVRRLRAEHPSPYQLTLPSLDYDHIPLEQVLDDLSQTAHTNIVTDWRSLGTEGVTRETPITVHLKDITVVNALRGIFGPLARPSYRINFAVYRDLILVSEYIQWSIDPSLLEAHAYNVEDLIELNEVPAASRRTTAVSGSEQAARMNRLMELLAPYPAAFCGWGGCVFVVGTPEEHARVRSRLQSLRQEGSADRLALTRPTTTPVIQGGQR